MILASNSPRRQEILKDMGFNFEVIVPNIEEESNKKDILEKIKDIAYKKAYSIAKNNKKEYVLAADTIVELEGEILGKPNDEEQARKFLSNLSGKTHRVITAYCFMNINKNVCLKNLEISEVKFFEISEEEMSWYIKSKEPLDKAGAYGIQGKGRMFVEQIKGDFFSIMGFPISKFIKDLKKIEISIKDIAKI